MSEVVALTYDTLPALSNLRREIDEHGNLRISIVIGEPGVLARRAALNSTAWISVAWSTMITVPLAALLASMFLANRPQTRALNALLMMAAGVFFCAMFLLVWWVEFRKRMDEIERAALQATVIHVSPKMMLVESVGTLGKVSATIPTPLELHCKRMPGMRSDCLHVVGADSSTTHLFVGLSTQELRWIELEIRRAALTA